MALQCLAWLEASLQREEPFQRLLPPDLSCFAVTALLATYPRAQVVISHRGRDCKLALTTSRVWGANEVSIDATFRPEWQTNRAMVWSLFSATPVLCRLQSANYHDSEWCAREAEMFDHLLGFGDFFEGRRYVEIREGQLAALEPAARSWGGIRLLNKPSGVESPPFELGCWPAWQGVVIRAAAAARLVHRFLRETLGPEGGSAQAAARFLSALYDPAAEQQRISVLGFDHIWQRLSHELRADASLLDLKGPLATARADVAFDASEARSWFQRHSFALGDGAWGDVDACDVLAALDWREFLEGYLRTHNTSGIYENQTGFIDLRGVSLEQWRGDPGWTVARGLLQLRLPYPLLLRQLADQGVENWPGPREKDAPIYTQHLEHQHVPQSEVFFTLQGAWPGIYYRSICAQIELCPELAWACEESLKTGPDPVYMRFDRRDEDFDRWMRERETGGSRG